MFRLESWDAVVAKQLQTDQVYAKAFVEQLLLDGEDPDEVIRVIVRAYGIKELAQRTHLRPQNIARVLREPAKARDNTLNRLVRPFGLQIERQLTFRSAGKARFHKLTADEKATVAQAREARRRGAKTISVAEARRRLLA